MIPLAYMRGRTLNEAFVILDEAQNTTVAQMKMFLTRMGLGTKMVVSGDTTQVDLPAHTRSGLIDAMHRLRGIEGFCQVTLNNEDIVRHRLVQDIVPRLRGRGAEEAALSAGRPMDEQCRAEVKNERGRNGWRPGAASRHASSATWATCSAATCWRGWGCALLTDRGAVVRDGRLDACRWGTIATTRRRATSWPRSLSNGRPRRTRRGQGRWPRSKVSYVYDHDKDAAGPAARGAAKPRRDRGRRQVAGRAGLRRSGTSSFRRRSPARPRPDQPEEQERAVPAVSRRAGHARVAGQARTGRGRSHGALRAATA